MKYLPFNLTEKLHGKPLIEEEQLENCFLKYRSINEMKRVPKPRKIIKTKCLTTVI